MNAQIEATYGRCWKTLAASEGHMKRFPPGVKNTVIVKSEEVERRRDDIVAYIGRNPGQCGAEIRRAMGIAVDTFSNDIARLVKRRRIFFSPGLNNRREYYLDDPDA